ncbi:hypothetical protein [Streptomyces sp. SAS_272]|uniref:hypothetical protein n=1 Tax=Streptomyces sp. SAS_272 TaxID=3412747 RepID=UPI00403C749C
MKTLFVSYRVTDLAASSRRSWPGPLSGAGHGPDLSKPPPTIQTGPDGHARPPGAPAVDLNQA